MSQRMTIQEMIDFLTEKGLIEEYVKPSSTPEREVRFTDGESITFESATEAVNYLEGMVKAVKILSGKQSGGNSLPKISQ